MLKLKRCDPIEASMQASWFSTRRLMGYADVPIVTDVAVDGYAYEWVEGRPAAPTDVQALFDYCRRHLWKTQEQVPYLPQDPSTYFRYVIGVAIDLGLTSTARFLGERWKRMLWTPVWQCHGDLTLENVVVAGFGQFVFIDPGFTRGLPCREMDEAKVCQSLEEAGLKQHTWSPEVRLMLLTHYVRLLRHAAKHSRERVEHARSRIEELSR